MADTSVEREAFSGLDLGIMETSTLGNLKAIDKFLNESEEVEEEEEEQTEEETDEEESSKKKPVQKKPVIKKKEPPKKKAEELLFEPEETEEEETEEKPEEKETEEEQNPSETPFEDLSKELIKLGVFVQTSQNQPVPKTGQEFLDRFQEEHRRGATQWLENFLSRFGPDRQELFEAVFVDGVDPKEYLPTYNKVEALKGIDLADEKNQQRVYREFYRRQGVSDEKIEARLQKSIDNGFLEEEAKDFLDQIVATDEQELENQRVQKAQKIQNDQREDQDYKNNLIRILGEKAKTRDFNGIPLTDDTVRKALDFLYTKKWKSGDQQFTDFDRFIAESKKSDNLEKRIAIALLELNNFDFSKIQKRAVSNETNELFNSLVKKKVTTAKDGKKASPASTKNWLETL